MINHGPEFTHAKPLSASKIKTFQHCSQKYWGSYHLKVPEKNNSGAQKGDVIHMILELLGVNKRKKLVAKIIKNESCRKIPAVWKLINIYMTRHGICTEEELEIVDKYILVGLNNEFYGPNGTFEILIEKDFDFEVVETNGKSYRVRGFLDKIFLVKKYNKLLLYIVDFKSNKKMYSAEEIEDNIQSNVYQLVIHYLYPEYELASLKFIFLKFPKNPVLESPLLDRESLSGFEWFLTEMQTTINNFSERNIGDNLGIQKWSTKFLCGPAKSGWICPHQKPLHYFAIEEGDQLVATGFTMQELEPKVKDGQRITKKFYSGCMWFHNEEGKPRRLEIS